MERGLGPLGRAIPCLLALAFASLLGSANPVQAADVAVILSADVDAYSEALKGFKAALRHRIVAEYSMEGDFDRGRRQVAEISAKIKPDLIFAVGIWGLQVVARQATDLPVVYAMVLNPPSVVGSGAKNITGASMNVPVDQTLRMLKQLGQIRRVGVVFDRSKTGYLVARAEAVAREEGLQLVAREIRSAKEAIPALEALGEQGIDALWVLPDETNLVPTVLQQMLLFSYRRKVPLIGLSESQAQMGALLSLSFASSEDIGRQAGELANSILAGKAPAEIPYTTARRVRLTVNLKAAQKLGMDIPKSILAAANNVIQ
ncbi:MAG: ABC transporter substrate-binding protein [Candidatus Rokuibacteriota bacterium]